MVKSLILITQFLFAALLLAQNINVPVGNPVYEFLQEARVKGITVSYDDAVLPLTQKSVVALLNEILQSPLSGSRDRELAAEFLSSIVFSPINADSAVSVFSFPFNDWQKSHFYVYRNKLVTFTGEPVLRLDYLHAAPAPASGNSALLVSYGGKFAAEYDSLVSVSIFTTNSSQYGSRDVALLDNRVAQSLTFNKTKLNNFDNTSAIITWQNAHLLLQGGRDRIIWGSSAIDKMMLSENPQQFDFLRFGAAYGVVSYNFLHGWLSQAPLQTPIDSVRMVTQIIQKYIALSRLGVRLGNFTAGFTQSVIYAARGPELAYLNPFLLWESAQRSLNDLDNSFLGIDFRYIPVPGVSLQAELLLDDINFATLFKSGWRVSGNRSAWQAGIHLSGNGLPAGFSLFAGITEVRPHCFSHPGITRDALAYTNNGWQLGTAVPPNAREWHVRVSWLPSAALSLQAGYRWLKHGKNVVGANGSIIRNTGGDVFSSYTYFTPPLLPLFDGVIERTATWYTACSWRYSSFIGFTAQYRNISYAGAATPAFTNWFSLSAQYAVH